MGDHAAVDHGKRAPAGAHPCPKVGVLSDREPLVEAVERLQHFAAHDHVRGHQVAHLALAVRAVRDQTIELDERRSHPRFERFDRATDGANGGIPVARGHEIDQPRARWHAVVVEERYDGARPARQPRLRAAAAPAFAWWMKTTGCDAAATTLAVSSTEPSSTTITSNPPAGRSTSANASSTRASIGARLWVGTTTLTAGENSAVRMAHPRELTDRSDDDADPPRSG